MSDLEKAPDDINHEQATAIIGDSVEAGHIPHSSATSTTNSSIVTRPEAQDHIQLAAREGSSLARFTSSISQAASRISKGKSGGNKEAYPEQNLDDGIVGWEGQNDPENPRRYSPPHKWTLLGLVSAIQFVSPFASSTFAPGVSIMDKEFHNTSRILSTFVVSVYLLGYAVGPLLFSPLSEIFGRRVVLNITTVNFALWQIGCALSPNLSALIVFRLLTGIGGSGCLAIGSGVIADLFEKEQRGLASTIYSVGPLFGPVLGPICGGFVAELAGWRWDFWVLLIAAGTVTSGILIFNRETNPKVLMKRKTQRLRKELNRDDLRSCYEVLHGGQPLSFKHIMLHGLIRPMKMFIFLPIVAILSTYMAFVYGLLYLLFTTITGVFQTMYGWPIDLCGLAYTGVGIGLFAGTTIMARVSDPSIKRLTKANNDIYEPEMRLKLCLPFACLIPISFFWYGWSIQAKTQWIVPILGLIPFGLGSIVIFISIQTYIIDSYTEYAASGVACITVTRSLFGAFLPLAGPSMYKSLGYGWGNSLLGFVALGMILVPIFLNRYGGVIRKRYAVSLE